MLNHPPTFGLPLYFPNGIMTARVSWKQLGLLKLVQLGNWNARTEEKHVRGRFLEAFATVKTDSPK